MIFSNFVVSNQMGYVAHNEHLLHFDAKRYIEIS